MKVTLVVTTTGPNNGRAIPITGANFIVGRDPDCHLRPASQAISKKHCAIILRDGRVWVQDFGSTNGTQLNGESIQGERQAKDGDAIKIGPLEFRLQVLHTPTPADGTPLPEKLRAVSPTTGTATQGPSAPVPIRPTTGRDTDTDEGMPPVRKGGEGDEDAAAMLLGIDDDDTSSEVASVPEGSTVMDMPNIDASGRVIPPKAAEKKDEAAESSSAAGDLLKKYFRRTGG